MAALTTVPLVLGAKPALRGAKVASKTAPKASVVRADARAELSTGARDTTFRGPPPPRPFPREIDAAARRDVR